EPEAERARSRLIAVRLPGDDRRLVPGLGPRELARGMFVAADDDGGVAVAELAGEISVGAGEHLGQRMTLAHQRPQRVADERGMDERLPPMSGHVADDDARRFG